MSGRPSTTASTQVSAQYPPPQATIRVPVDTLQAADSPRLEGLDTEHARTLAEVDAGLPAILVQRSTMRVIDGMHRLYAARLKGQESIEVCFFEGDEEEAFLLAVEANVTHGLPLTLADRRVAAERIIRSWPEASDRWIANIAGLAAKTVAAIRRGAAQSTPQPAARIGRDGRLRPTDSKDRRRRAGELFAAQPEASLRKIAKSVGISVGTARDVRDKIRRGLDPVRPKRRRKGTEERSGQDTTMDGRNAWQAVDARPVLERLRQDPSLRYTEAGRSLLRWLSPSRLIDSSEWQSMVNYVPPHCAVDIARIARGSALAWMDFADELDRRNRDCG
jgi:hypothetical protein